MKKNVFPYIIIGTMLAASCGNGSHSPEINPSITPYLTNEMGTLLGIEMPASNSINLRIINLETCPLKDFRQLVFIEDAERQTRINPQAPLFAIESISTGEKIVFLNPGCWDSDASGLVVAVPIAKINPRQNSIIPYNGNYLTSNPNEKLEFRMGDELTIAVDNTTDPSGTTLYSYHIINNPENFKFVDPDSMDEIKQFLLSIVPSIDPNQPIVGRLHLERLI